MNNKNLYIANKAKNDEFYTQYEDIDKEIKSFLSYNPNTFQNKTILCPCDNPELSNFTKYFVSNFVKLKLQKLICTSYAYGEEEKGRLLIVNREDFPLSYDKLNWTYLEGDGDFCSDEIKSYRSEADVIITNPPFSVYKVFVPWLLEEKKQFLVIANKNSVTYKEVFPLFMSGKIWSGNRSWSGGMWFETQNLEDVDKVVNGVNMKNVASTWFTNIEHGKRHKPLALMTLDDNKLYSKHKKIREYGYRKYDNYDAIEVPFTDAIPSDYDGVMGVPISFLEKYCPDQFEIVGATESEGKGFSKGLWNEETKIAQPMLDGIRIYKRIFIKARRAMTSDG